MQLFVAAVVGVTLAAGCARRPPVGTPTPGTDADSSGARGGRRPAQRPGAGPSLGALPATGVAGLDRQAIARQMGLIAGSSLMQFVARVAFFADPRPDSTLVLLSVTVPNRSLSFVRDGDRYSANYSVTVELRRGTQVIRQFTARELVRVAAFREAARFDESIIFQQYLRLAPGTYAMGVGVKDEGSVRVSGQEVSLTVPPLREGQLSSIVPVYESIARSAADSQPRVLAAPRGTFSFGVDTVAPVYVEAYGLRGPTRVGVSAVTDSGVVMWEDSLTLNPSGTGGIGATTVAVPLRRIGVGFVTVRVARRDQSDTARTKLLVTLGDDLPVTSFEEMLTYLRLFARSDRLKTLREATGPTRATLWTTFLHETDPNPATAENEALRDYLNRVRSANARFREEGRAGWLSDRGMAYVGLGDPDNIVQSGNLDPGARNRTETWVYTGLRLQLLFVDQSGFGRWRLSPQAQTELQQAINRRLVG
jgi:GWxTD domain-containing protein